MKYIGNKGTKKYLILLIVISIFLFSPLVQANTQSVNVAIIGSPRVINGGIFPTTGPDLVGISFTNLAPGSVNAGSLAAYDTVVLNVASSEMRCNINTLSGASKTALVNFVNAGNKMIIYDSECRTQDYSWLPFPFTTANPGAMGGTGTLTILEENTLSSKFSSNPYYINAVALGGTTDAVGDMNVMTTYNPNWCIDMSGTNYRRQTGPVHTYAKTGADTGLLIYNGLDLDYLGYYRDPGLRKIFVQELKQPFNPSNLPCGQTVVGITLTPTNATNLIGTTHTVTATLKDLLGNPQTNVLVNFSVVSGPNSGNTGSGTTDALGQVSYTYTGAVVGTDAIEACFTNSGGQNLCSQNAVKIWVKPPNVPPVADAGGSYIGDEGSAITLNGSASYDSDAGDSIVSYEWDLDNDGVYDVSGVTVSNTWPDDYSGMVTLMVTDTYGETDTANTTVTVNNVAPVVTSDSSYYATVPITLRIAGQGSVGNSVGFEIIQDGNVIASDIIVREPGSPDEQTATISATIDFSKPYSGRLVFDTETAISGGTPVWLVIDDNRTKITTFTTQKKKPASYHQTYNFDMTDLVSLVGKEVTFSATASDPGTDDLVFAWNFGDGGVISNSYLWSGSHTVTDTVTHTYSSAGSYAVGVVVTDDDSGVGTDSNTIVIS